MTSLREYGRRVGERYIWGLAKEPDPEKSHIPSVSFLGADTKYPVGELGFAMLRKIALREPYINKAIHKKNMDTVRNWFTIKPEKGTGRVPQQDLDLIHTFDKRTNIPYKFYVGGVCSNIYGTGFLERTFIGEEKPNMMSDIPKKKPLGLPSMNSEFITEKKRNPKDKRDDTSYYVFKGDTGHEVLIHPNRIIDIAVDRLPFSEFGISVIHVAMNILKSKMNADVSSGEILSWFGSGMLDMTIDHATEEQQRKMLEDFKKHPSYFAHDEFYKLDVKNPTRIDPEPFYKYFERNIAAAMKMPVHILTGESIGNVTGSEIGISDYYHDVENIQKVIFTPLLEKIYKQLLESHGRNWKYEIHWNPIFVDELSEAKILQLRTFSSTQNKNSGIVDVPEARRILNDGVVDLDINKVPEKKEPEQPVIPPTLPNVEPQPPVKKPTVKQTVTIIPYLTPAQKEMIEKERLKGEIEIIEQEKRVKEAELIINEKKIQKQSSESDKLAKVKKGKKRKEEK